MSKTDKIVQALRASIGVDEDDVSRSDINIAEEFVKQITYIDDFISMTPEWDRSEMNGFDDYVHCNYCHGTGLFTRKGKPSKKLPPTHEAGCVSEALRKYFELQAREK